MVQNPMKRALVALLALLSLAGPAFSQAVGPPALFCNKSFTVSAGATAITQVVAAASGSAVHICGYDINAGAAAGTFQLSTGTGTNCGTGTVNITPAFSLGINGVLVSRPGAVWYSSPSGNALCYTITGTGPINAVVLYGQY